MKPRFEHAEHKEIAHKKEQLNTTARSHWNNWDIFSCRIDHLLEDFSRHDMRSIRWVQQTHTVLIQEIFRTGPTLRTGEEFVEARFGIKKEQQ